MTVEVNPNYPSDLNLTLPLNGDFKSEGDDHLRNIKRVLKTTFPNVSGAVTPTHTVLNYMLGVTSAVQTQIDAANASRVTNDALKANLAGGNTFTGTQVLPAATSIGTVSDVEIAYLDGVTSGLQAQLNLKAPLASPALTGVPTAPTAAVGVGTDQLATCAFVAATSLVSALPGQTGNAGKFVTTDGTNASWGDPTAGSHHVTVTTGNGHGSTNTKIRRFTTTESSAGTAITYADSAANGASFTIAAGHGGLYAIHYADCRFAAEAQHGVSLNSAQLTTNIDSITAANRLGITTGPQGTPDTITVVARLVAGDVVRPHTIGTQDMTAASATIFTIRKVSA